MYKKFLKSFDNLKIFSYFKNPDKYRISVILIVLLSFVIRFYDFSGRWGIGADSARDALIALEALHRHQLPMMGPFSSAGPFVTGGIYYWLIMASYMIFPFLTALADPLLAATIFLSAI